MPPLAVLNDFVYLFDRSVALNETIEKIVVYIIKKGIFRTQQRFGSSHSILM